MPVIFPPPRINVLPTSYRSVSTIEEFLSDRKIELKSDFIRKVAVLTNNNVVTTWYEVNIYYDLLVSILGIDKIKISCMGTTPSRERRRITLKTFTLEDKLSPREQEVVKYIRGIIRYAIEMANDRSPEDVVRETLIELFSSPASIENSGSNWLPEKIIQKFPEIKIKDGLIFLKSFSAFSSVDNGAQLIKIPLRKDYFNLHDESVLADSFKNACFKALENKVDPLQCFIKNDLMKSPNSKDQFNPISEIDFQVLSSFFQHIQPLRRRFGTRRRNNLRDGIESNVFLNNFVSNMKKLSFKFKNNDAIDLDLETIEVVFLKRGNNSMMNFEDPIPTRLVVRECMRLQNKIKFKLGSAPIVYENRRNPYMLTIVQEREQFHNDRVRVMNCNRPVSIAPSVNSSFIITDASDEVIQDVEVDSIHKMPFTSGVLNLNRSVVYGLDSGEFKVNSTVIRKNGVFLEGKIEPVVLMGFCISSRETGNPANVLKLANLPTGVTISSATYRANYNSNYFDLPFASLNEGEIIHGDPIPGVKYEYRVNLVDNEGNVYKDARKTEILTLPRTPRGLINLVDLGDFDHPEGGTFVKIGLPKSEITAYSRIISTKLQRIFSGNVGGFFSSEPFQEALNRDLSTIGNEYTLNVSYISTKTGNILDNVLISVDEVSSTIDHFIFPIAKGIYLEDYITQYNLVITNPLDIVNIANEGIEDRDSRREFIRKTSKFFQTSGKIKGEIPATSPSPQENIRNAVESYRVANQKQSDDLFYRMVCAGGFFNSSTINSNSIFYNLNYRSTTVVQNGECILEWSLNRPQGNIIDKIKYLDFFIITAIINGAEIPLTGYPFLGIIDYTVRLPSFLGVASRVQFKIYPVYHDYNIHFEGAITTEEINILDERVLGAWLF